MIHDRKISSAWFVAGLGLGALAGVLLAPKSGRETRQAIATGVDNGRKQLASLGRDARKRMSDIAESGKKILALKKKQVSAVLETGRNWAKQAKESSLPRTGTH
jgi:gas vesicle protein